MKGRKQVVVQQDNAGPHIEEAYSQWIHEQFEMLGWMYELQAPQGDYYVVFYVILGLVTYSMTVYSIVCLYSC